MTPGSRPKAIFFDNDGVLVDTEELFFEATGRTLGRLGVALSRETHNRISLGRGGTFQDIALAAGAPEDADFAGMRLERNRIYSEMLEEAAAKDSLVIPGVREAISSLRRRFILGIVTSCMSAHFEIIHRRSGLLEHFSFVVGEGDYGSYKPHPEPYLTALSKARVPPEKALCVEDSERGVQSATAAGMPCAAIPRGISAQGDFSKAWRIFASIREFETFMLEPS